MATFVLPQIRTHPCTEIVIADPNRPGWQKIGWVPGNREPNKPVNLDMCLTFYPRSTDEMYMIKFESATLAGGHIIWLYPMTEEGKQLRDEDLARLEKTYANVGDSNHETNSSNTSEL